MSMGQIESHIVKELWRFKKEVLDRAFDRFNPRGKEAQRTLLYRAYKAHTKLSVARIVKTDTRDGITLNEYGCHRSDCSCKRSHACICICGNNTWKIEDTRKWSTDYNRAWYIPDKYYEYTTKISCTSCGHRTSEFLSEKTDTHEPMIQFVY